MHFKSAVICAALRRSGEAPVSVLSACRRRFGATNRPAAKAACQASRSSSCTA